MRLEQMENGPVVKFKTVSGVQAMQVSLPKALQWTSRVGLSLLHGCEDVTHSASRAGMSAFKSQFCGSQTTSASGTLRLFIEASEARVIEAVSQLKVSSRIHALQGTISLTIRQRTLRADL